jgi:hypothetical protein
MTATKSANVLEVHALAWLMTAPIHAQLDMPLTQLLANAILMNAVDIATACTECAVRESSFQAVGTALCS